MLKWRLKRVFLMLSKRSLGHNLISLGPLLDMQRCTEVGHQLLGVICGSFDHLSYNCTYHLGRREVFGNTRVNGQNANNLTHPNPLSKMIPRSVLLNSGIKPISTARPAVSTARPAVATARNKNRVYPKPPVTTFVKSTQTGKKTNFEKKVYNNHKRVPKISKPAVTTARPKVTTGGSVNKKKGKYGKCC
jgi:hypothetical protein